MKGDNSLILGDCVDVMSGMDNNIIDLTVTSPPYDDIRQYKGDISNWSADVWKNALLQLFRITKPGGVVVWVVGDKTNKGSESGTSFKQALYAKECGFFLYDTMIYSKYSLPKNAKRYEQSFEFMFIFSKGKIKTFNPIMVPCKKFGASLKNVTARQNGKPDELNEVLGHQKCIKEYKIKRNIWHYHTGRHSTVDKYAHEHPAIFPEGLASDHILSWSNPGETVFDPFAGSGTTGKAAVLLDRRFIGIEANRYYYDIAVKRIGDYTQQDDTGVL